MDVVFCPFFFFEVVLSLSNTHKVCQGVNFFCLHRSNTDMISLTLSLLCEGMRHGLETFLERLGWASPQPPRFFVHLALSLCHSSTPSKCLRRASQILPSYFRPDTHHTSSGAPLSTHDSLCLSLSLPISISSLMTFVSFFSFFCWVLFKRQLGTKKGTKGICLLTETREDQKRTRLGNPCACKGGNGCHRRVGVG